MEDVSKIETVQTRSLFEPRLFIIAKILAQREELSIFREEKWRKERIDGDFTTGSPSDRVRFEIKNKKRSVCWFFDQFRSSSLNSEAIGYILHQLFDDRLVNTLFNIIAETSD